MRRAKAAHKRAKNKKAVEKCLTCSNKAQSRGLCWRCSAAANASINRGDVTEQELIDRGLMKPIKKLGRRPGSGKSGFAVAMAKASPKKK